MVGCSGDGSGGSVQPTTNTSTFLPTTSGASGPTIANISPSNPFPGGLVTITGSGFGTAQLNTSRVFFSADGTTSNLDGGSVAVPADWTDTQIRIRVPSSAVTGPVTVIDGFRTVNEQHSNALQLTVKRAFDPNSTPKVVFINPASAQFVGLDTPITLIFDRPIKLGTITNNTTAVSIQNVALPDASLKQQTPPQDPCSFPFVCDLRTQALLNCTCATKTLVTSITDISASLKSPPATAFLVQHAPFFGGVAPTCVVSINSSIKADGSLDADGNPLAQPGPDVPSLGEIFFFFVQ